MSILYRATWSDSSSTNRPDVVERLKTCVAAWAHETDQPAQLEEGDREIDVSQGRHRLISLRTLNAESFEVTTTDEVAGDSTEWTTSVRVIADEQGVHTLVELSMSSDDLARRISVGRPRIVHDLLTVVDKPRLGGSGVLTELLPLPANGISVLVEMLALPSRTLPIIVCAEPNFPHNDSWQQIARTIAARSEGVAVVITLERAAVAEFRSLFGSLAIWDGGIRVYSPGVVVPEAEGWRHRYYLRSRLEESRSSTVDRIVYSVAQLSTRRRVPDVFRVFGEQSGLPSGALGGMIPAQMLADAREEWEFQIEEARDEQSALEKELAHANGHLARLKTELIEQGFADLLWATLHEDTTSVPDEVQVVSEEVGGKRS